jgi:hypothetical protein
MTPELYMKTVQVEVEKRYKLRPWKKYKTTEQWREITKAWEYKGTTLSVGWKWNGSSSPRIAWAVISPFKHPKASAYHDKKCAEASAMMAISKGLKDEYPELAEDYKDRAIATRRDADKEYGVLVGNSDGKILQHIATASVKTGSFLGYGW